MFDRVSSSVFCLLLWFFMRELECQRNAQTTTPKAPPNKNPRPKAIQNVFLPAYRSQRFRLPSWGSFRRERGGRQSSICRCTKVFFTKNHYKYPQVDVLAECHMLKPLNKQVCIKSPAFKPLEFKSEQLWDLTVYTFCLLSFAIAYSGFQTLLIKGLRNVQLHSATLSSL